MAQHSFLKYIIHHVFLPPRLPQEDDSDVEKERKLIIGCLDELRAFQNFLPQEERLPWQSCIKMLTEMLRVRAENGDLSTEKLDRSFEDLTDGDILPLHIRAQNAGLIIRMTSDKCCFESFEVSPTNSAVMENVGRLRRRFPGPAIAIDRHRIADAHFRLPFAHQLAQLDSEVLEQASPVVRKAGSNVREIRDTTHPRYVTEMLTGMLRAMGHPLEIVRLQKNMRDEVLWQDTLLPWRRSPVWLLLRVALQRNLMLQYKPAESLNAYKSFMIFFMTRILRIAFQKGLPSDILFVMIAKITRRGVKLQNADQSPCFRFVDNTIIEVHQTLINHWKSVEQISPVARLETDYPTFQSSLMPDSNLSLVSLGPFLAKLQTRVPLPPTDQKFAFICRPRLSQSDRVLPSLAYAGGVAPGENHLLLADLEEWVSDSLDGWLGTILDHDSAAVQLADLTDQYWKLAKTIYVESAEDFSRMILTIMELWIALDKCVLRSYPLLKDYDPEFPSTLFHPLLLPWRSMMERLGKIERYFIQRKQNTRPDCPSIYTSFSTSLSFPIRYFNDSSRHKALLQTIKSAAQSKRAAKVLEFEEKHAEYGRLLQQSHALSCQYTNQYVGYREFSEHDPKCKKCALKSQAEGLSVDVHEWPLPDDNLEAEAVVFELDVPAALCKWRNITYTILVDILSQRQEADSPRRKQSKRTQGYSAHEYAGLRKYVSSPPGRLQLISDTKPFVVSHYARQKVSEATKGSVCVKNGLTYIFYDTTASQTPQNLLGKCDIRVPCTIKLPPGPYKALQYAVSDTIHTSNEVIAKQANYPEGLTVHEYFAFASLRSGCRLQWRNIIRELRARTLNFECEELYVLIIQTIWQVGPGQDMKVCRDSHQDLEETEFVSELLSVLEESLSNVEENWRGAAFVRTMVAVASRILTFSMSGILLQRCSNFLKRARDAALRWTRELRNKLQQAETDTETQNVNDRVLEMALTCYTTFDVDPHHLSEVFRSIDDLAILTECAIIIHDRRPASESGIPNSVKMLLRQARRLAQRLEIPLREKILLQPEGLDLTLCRIWPGYLAGNGWKAMGLPSERWIETETPSRNEFLSVTVHFNLLDGSLLINSMPLTRLPGPYESHPLYQRLFGQKSFDVVPSDMEGMMYATRSEICGSQFHFGFYDSQLVIRSRSEKKLFELLPARSLDGDFPESFVKDYVHWFDVGSGDVEWRPFNDRWKSSPSNWHMKYANLSPRALIQGSKMLLEIRSPTVKNLSLILAPLEYSQHVHVIFDHQDDSLSVHLPRLRLDFFIHKQSLVLQSKQYRGMYIDPNQSLGTLTGLSNKLLLRNETGSERCVLIPFGKVQYRHDDRHVLVSVNTASFKNVDHHFYTIDAELGCLKEDGSLRSQLFKYYLHALTAHFLPDQLTRRTGTEEALCGLRTAASRSFLKLSLDEIDLLERIAELTPRRKFYPQNLQVMQEVEWKELSPLSQHNLFLEAVELIMQQARKFDVFQLEPTILPNVSSDSSSVLNQRASIRASTFYGEGFGAEMHTTDYDFSYTGRDNLSSSSSEHHVYHIARLTDHWSTKLTGCGNLMREIESWWLPIGGSNTESENLLLYKKQLLDLITTWLPKKWSSLQTALSESTSERDKYRIMIFLSTLIYSGRVTAELAQTFLAFATVPQLRLLRPPNHSSFELVDGYKPDRAKLLKTVQNHVRPYSDCPEVRLSSLPEETISDTERRRRKAHEKAQQARVETFVNAVLAQWHQEAGYSPEHTDYDVYILTTGAMAEVYAWFQSWRRNIKFKAYICEAQQVLDSLTKTELPAQYYSVSYSWHASAPPSTHIRFEDVTRTTAPNPLPAPSFFDHKLLAQNDGHHGIQNGLLSLLNRLKNQSSTDFEKHYVEDLLRSFESLSEEVSFTLTESSPAILDLLKKYIQQCRDHTHSLYQAMCRSLQIGMGATRRTAFEIGLGPRTSPAFFLQLLSSKKYATLSANWRKDVLGYAISICALQRAHRLVQTLGNAPEFIEELRNIGHAGWDPAAQTDWLLFEIENNILIRPVQAQIAKEMIKPSSGKNSVLQLGMGEGKSSVIVPIVAAALANGKQLARVLVLKPLANQMFHLLVQKLGRMLDRPIFYMPFSRSLDLDANRAEKIFDLYRECAQTRGILVLQPEHLLSFELMGPERFSAGQTELGQTLVKTQSWLEKQSRDILDESDEILSVRFELVYTIGTQQTIECSPHRWVMIQHILGLMATCSRRILENYPQSLEVRPQGTGRYSLVRILRAFPGTQLVIMVAKEVCNNGVPGVPVWTFQRSTRASLLKFLTEADQGAQFCPSFNFETQSMANSLLLLRALFAGGILGFAFHRKRWRVNYGLDLSRSMLAVPYHAKDIPAPRAEFSHPDVTIVLTCLSYYHGGLSDEQLHKAFDTLLLSDQAEEEYERWTHNAVDLKAAFRQLRGINLKNNVQCAEQVFPPLRFSKGAIDFYLSNHVFPREMKEFPHKMSASGWNIARTKSHPTTGFSGTNDSRYILPLSIEQLNLAQQRHTNASVLNILLKPENTFRLSEQQHNGQTLDAETLLQTVVTSTIPTRVILDVGAQVLEMRNQEFALSWLRRLSAADAQAAIFFDESNELSVVNRDGIKEQLTVSPFAKQMDQCLVYLDESHTRGTDLKMPSNYRAAVTLGPDLTKDRLLQACLRMRKLDRGQSLMFCGPPDVEDQILQLNSKSRNEAIEVSDIIAWSIANTYSYTRRNVSLWAIQGIRYQRHHLAWSEVLSSKEGAVPASFSDSLLEEEAQSIKERYGSAARRLTSQVIERARENIGHKRGKELNAIQKRCHEFGVASFDNATLQEEQERELSPENEEERQIQLPPPMQPCQHNLNPDVVALIRQGILRRSSGAFEPAFNVLLRTRAAPQLEIEAWPKLLLVTKDFKNTVKTRNKECLDFYLRPVQWVISHVEAGKVSSILLSPFEVQALLPDIRKFRNVTLHVYSPRVVASVRSLEDLSFCAIPQVSPTWSSPPAVTMHLNLFAGQLYLRSYAEYVSLCRFLGLCYHPPDDDVHVTCDGFMDPSNRAHYDQAMEESCPFSASPVDFLKILMAIRRQGQGFSKSHIGKITSGEMLKEEAFEQLP